MTADPAPPSTGDGTDDPTPPPGDLIAVITDRLNRDQARDIVVIDISEKTSYADYLVIASGTATRKVRAMAEHLREDIRRLNGVAPQLEGMNNADWVLIDAGDVIVHLFRPEVRDFYQIERLWGQNGS